tara:strand:+ start:25 stop:180 length:156 start_codon:yes stop_codon:yes gene_type:complete
MDTLEYWKHVFSERTEDYEFELARGEDDTLIKLCREAVEEAENKIEKLEDV